MELDDLKTTWNKLDKRLEGVEANTNRLTAQVINGKFTSSKRHLIRVTRMGILLLALLPVCFMHILHYEETSTSITVKVLLALFIFTLLIRQIILLILLKRINPEQQTIRETCAAVLRFRRWFFAGFVMGVVLGVPLIIAFGIYTSRLTTPYVFYGFLSGLIIGLPLAIRLFLRMWGEIQTLRTVLKNAEEQTNSTDGE